MVADFRPSFPPAASSRPVSVSSGECGARRPEPEPEPEPEPVWGPATGTTRLASKAGGRPIT